MAAASAHHSRGRCAISTRIGMGRSLAFGVLSAGVPALAHGSTAMVTLVLVLALAGGAAAWSWHARCTPRSAAALASTLLLSQLLVHLVLMLVSPTHSASLPTGSLHAHAVTDSGVAAAGIAMMAALHLVAVVYGVIALLALERRALRFVVDCARRIGAIVGFGTSRPAGARAAGTSPRLAMVGAADADARRARQLGRSQARRGPPATSTRHQLVAA